MDKVSPAVLVIERFGGQANLARLVGKSPSTVRYWAKTGTIPSKLHATILRLAGENGMRLAPGELVEGSSNILPTTIATQLPRATAWGNLGLSERTLPCFVLDDGRRVISRTGATDVLTGGKGGGNLESYLRTEAIRPYVPGNFADLLIEFDLPEVTNKIVKGMAAETFLDLCTAFVRARDESADLTPRQIEIAALAGMVLAACAKVGLIALIDEATGYQYTRAEDALRVKLKIFLEEEMRKWEKTFPDELWKEFGRLTRWEGSVVQRPRYWGKLVMQLIYEYLDPDVADWLRNNVPAPRHGQNYHQWLTSQYGLKRLTEHIWMVIGMARACQNMSELQYRMAEQFGRQPLQITLFLDPPKAASTPG